MCHHDRDVWRFRCKTIFPSPGEVSFDENGDRYASWQIENAEIVDFARSSLLLEILLCGLSFFDLWKWGFIFSEECGSKWSTQRCGNLQRVKEAIHLCRKSHLDGWQCWQFCSAGTRFLWSWFLQRREIQALQTMPDRAQMLGRSWRVKWQVASHAVFIHASLKTMAQGCFGCYIIILRLPQTRQRIGRRRVPQRLSKRCFCQSDRQFQLHWMCRRLFRSICWLCGLRSVSFRLWRSRKRPWLMFSMQTRVLYAFRWSNKMLALW